MPANIVFPEWLNANSLRNFPLRENVSRKDVSGEFTIPNSLIVGAQINCSRDYASGRFFVSKLIVSTTSISVFVSYQTSGGSPETHDIGGFSVSTKDFTPYTYFPFSGQGEHSAVLGSLAIGNVTDAINAGIGTFLFSPQDTEFEVNTYFVSVPALKHVEVYNANNELLHRATEVLKLRAGENIRLTYITDGNDETDYGSIRIDAIAKENLVEPSECENSVQRIPPCIKQINGVSPNEAGVIFLSGSECIDVTDKPEAFTLELSDTCAESCCGCVELQALTDALERLRAQESALQTLISNTQSQQSELLANLIANL